MVTRGRGTVTMMRGTVDCSRSGTPMLIFSPLGRSSARSARLQERGWPITSGMLNWLRRESRTETLRCCESGRSEGDED